MKVLSYNIWNYAGGWTRRRELLLDIMRQESPDIIALQEVRHGWHDRRGQNQARWLAEQLGYHWVYRPASIFWPVPLVVEGLAFLTKEPIRRFAAFAVPQLRWAGPSRVILHARVGEVDLYNVHFPLTQRARVVEAQQIVRIAEERSCGPALVMGDFNADAEQEPMQIFWLAGFVDLWDQLAPPAQPVVWPSDRRIDYILGGSGRNWEGTIVTVGDCPNEAGENPSDHPGLLAQLRW